MSREGDAMRRSFKRVLIPELSKLGFVMKAANFVRIEGDDLDLLSIQYSKFGGEFILEFARTMYRDPLTGAVVPEHNMDVTGLGSDMRGRLQRPNKRPSQLNGFQFSGFGESVEKYDALATEVVMLLPQIDAWLRTGVVGTHINAKPHQR
jgi:hypothetical protein